MSTLRGYQVAALNEVHAYWAAGVRGVCLVAPTGSGKTVMGQELVRSCPGVTLWLTHTKELVAQTAKRLSDAGLSVGIIAAGIEYTVGCRCYVSSIQTLVSRDMMPLCDQIIADEVHHFASDEWGDLLKKYPFTPLVGLTATPERADGRPLSDVMQALVVAAHYSELTEAGHLVPVRLLRPAAELDRGMAKDPVDAYLTKGEGRPGFIYSASVPLAHEHAKRLTAAGVPSACIEANTPTDERAALLEQFKSGALRVLTNMKALTEGVDVPQASVCIIGRTMGHVSTYLQAAGRVLRPHESKLNALIIDLPGLSHRFGPPNEDRIYSLEGEGIRRNALAALRVCLHCGMTFVPKAVGACPQCGERNPVDKPKAPRIYNEELREVFSGPGTPSWAKRAELTRLENLSKLRGYGDAWVSRQYKAAFSELPEAWRPAEDSKRSEFRRLSTLAQERGYSQGWAAHRYKSTYGCWPARSWRES